MDISTVLYRTAELEVVVETFVPKFYESDWYVVAHSHVRKLPRVTFIASLGLVSPKGSEDTNNQPSSSDALDIPFHANLASEEENSIGNFFEPFLINQTCRKLAYRRGHPLEVLYDCFIDDFYSIAFTWTESLLLDIDGRAQVKAIHTVHLPDSLFASKYPGEYPSDRDICLKSLNSPPSLTLLEALYVSNEELNQTYRRVSTTEVSDDSIFSNPEIFDRSCSIPDLNRSRKSSSLRVSRGSYREIESDTLRYRNYSLSPKRPLFSPLDPVSAFIKYIHDRDITHSSMFQDRHDENCEQNVSRNVSGGSHEYSHLPPHKYNVTPLTSRFVMSTVHEDELVNVALNDGSKPKILPNSARKNDPSCTDETHLIDGANESKREQIHYIMGAACVNESRHRRHSALVTSNILSCDLVAHERRRSLSPFSCKNDTRSCLLYREAFLPKSFIQTRRHLLTGKEIDRVQAKPQAILVYTGDKSDLFSRLATTLSGIISDDAYTVFHLSSHSLHNHPWINRETLCLIVSDTKDLDDKAWERLQQYFSNSGKVVFFCQNNLLASLSSCDSMLKKLKLLKRAFNGKHSTALGKDFEHFLKKTFKYLYKHKAVNETFHSRDIVGGCQFSVAINKSKDSPLLFYMQNSTHNANALFSDATNEQLCENGSTLIADALSRLSIDISPRTTLPSLTRGYLICQNDRLPWNMKGMQFNVPFGSSPKIIIKQIEKDGDLPPATSELLPVEMRTRIRGLPEFCENVYFSKLKTEKIGSCLIYVPVCESTQDIARSLAFAMRNESVVVVARQQTKGKGRSGNMWLSPIGCATFSFNFIIPPNTRLSSNISFVQHIIAVAIVDGICSLDPKLENLQLNIKWPNDIYHGRLYKMGGVVVNASTINEITVCTIGAGLNISNSKPTVSVNDVLPVDCNVDVNIEEYIANTLNKFVDYVEMFQTCGRQKFLEHYYRYWLHSREEVTLVDSNEKVVIRGLDEHGFLQVRSRQTGKIIAVHPDGNAFDIMTGLISVKY